MSTPISESGFTGTAVGAAIGGMRPVVEFMVSDFMLLPWISLSTKQQRPGT